MNTHDEFEEAVPLTSGERETLAAADGGRMPDDTLRQRTVAALRAEGLLRPAVPARSGLHVAPSWWAAAAAALVAVFLGGLGLGQSLASRAAADAMLASHEQERVVTAAWIQQLGSAYVTALASLARRDPAGGATADLEQSEAVARAVLIGAVAELARLRPDDADMALMLGILEAESRPAAGRIVRTVSF
ncbi:MAG TPA: hypothetical protein VK939_05970 [Longimicrobiales bacterium]|nr:hypothetical protein [Longimicrobiales bacterium]